MPCTTTLLSENSHCYFPRCTLCPSVRYSKILGQVGCLKIQQSMVDLRFCLFSAGALEENLALRRVKQLIHALRNGLVLSTFTLAPQPAAGRMLKKAELTQYPAPLLPFPKCSHTSSSPAHRCLSTMSQLEASWSSQVSGMDWGAHIPPHH